MQTFLCNTCNQQLPNTERIHKKKYRCKPCENTRLRQKRATDPAYREARKTLYRNWLSLNQEKKKEYENNRRAKNPSTSKERSALWRLRHPELSREKNRRWGRANKQHKIAHNKWRKLLVTNRIPKWMTKVERIQIKTFYKGCPKGFHVDHIIPLNGKNVSGLHVLANLQYLLAADNLRKSNKF